MPPSGGATYAAPVAGEITSCTVERTMSAEPMAIYRAWTEAFDHWFATPGAIRMVPVVGEPYWFEVVHEGVHHPHYGRFLALVPGVLIEQTWVTGRGGTDGAETVVRVELTEAAPGTHLRLNHRGFLDAGSMRQHADSWPAILDHLDETLTGAD
jgi:uncharacterized protein YndB with AHSA1/START domain